MLRGITVSISIFSIRIMDFKKQKPIYLQIADTMCERILNGEWKPDERIASVREVAEQLGVNPNTALRSFDYLQNAEIIFNRRGVGYFVAAEAKSRALNLQREYFLNEELPYCVSQMHVLGLSFDDLKRHADNV